MWRFFIYHHNTFYFSAWLSCEELNECRSVWNPFNIDVCSSVWQEKRISSLDAANARLMSALTQVKERYSMHNLRNGLSPTNPTKLSITENGEFRNSSCWSGGDPQTRHGLVCLDCYREEECPVFYVNRLYPVQKCLRTVSCRFAGRTRLTAVLLIEMISDRFLV